MRLICNQKELFNYLEDQLKQVPLDQMAKTFKLSLASFFSKENGQELPEGGDSIFQPFPPRFNRLLKRRWVGRNRRRVRDTWDLLQAKKLSNPVPRSMIEKAYAKHGEILSTVGKTPDAVLATLRTVSREWAEEVRRVYQEKIPLAPSKAYFGYKRSEGGCFAALKPFYSRNISRGNPLLTGTRIDPPMIYLEGKPGVGKSFLSNAIVKRLSERFGESDDLSCYWRNYATDHCDDYKGQLVFGVDDAFQVSDSVAAPDKIVDQLIQMKSNNEFILPMAKLQDKGMKFKSEFLLFSSNSCPVTVAKALKHISHPAAFARRIPYWYRVHEYDRTRKVYRIQKYTMNLQYKDAHCSSDSYQLEYDGIRGVPSYYMEVSGLRFVEIVVEDAITAHNQAVSSALASVNRKRGWRIPLVPYGAYRPSFGYEFPSELPKENEVEAFAIPEPLKVRMITKEQPLSYALKPLQKAMAKALTKFPCFFPGFKGEIEEFVNRNLEGQNGFILSGDYDSATDRLNSDIMSTCLSELKKVFSSHTVLCQYMDFFGGQHVVHYPEWTKLQPVVQRNGQLMGSLLSFPILCIANAATLCHLRKQGLSELKACINGDDILFVDTDRHIRSWKRISTSMGLVPSVGKNFQSRSFGTINSQMLFRKKKDNSFFFRQTGKSGMLVRKDLPLPKLALEAGFSKAQIVTWSKSALVKYPESLEVPESHGGFGNCWGEKKETRQDRLIYLFKKSQLLSHNRKVLPIDDEKGLICLPRILYQRLLKGSVVDREQEVEDYRLFSQSQCDSLIPDHGNDLSFPWREFVKFRTHHKKVQLWREFVKTGCLKEQPPLLAFRPVWTTLNTGEERFVTDQLKRIVTGLTLRA